MSRDRGRGQRVLDGVWRLRVPLPWPGVPHGNAWAVRRGDGVVLFDTGVHEPATAEHPSSWSELELAMAQVGLRPADVKLVVCTHAHADHYGQAAPIVELTGCELWMHPNHAHTTAAAADPDRAWERRIEVGLQSGVPRSTMLGYREARGDEGPPIAEVIEPHRELLDGVEVETDLGVWRAYETPGHAPSHVCLHQPERGLLISGDHLLGRISLYYDYGYTPDPVGEFLASLETIERLDVRLCLAGHGRPFRDVAAHIEANRAKVAGRVESIEQRLSAEPQPAFELLPPDTPPEYGPWFLTETLCYLTYLERRERVVRSERDGVEVWAAP